MAIEGPTDAPPGTNLWPLRVAALALGLLGLVPIANFIVLGARVPWWGSAGRQWLAWTSGTCAIALLLGVAFPSRIEGGVEAGSRMLRRPSDRAFAMALFAGTTVLALLCGWYLFAWQASVGDEFAQDWQAHLLATGRLFARAEPHAEFFSTAETLVVGRRWFSQFPMGWPFIRAVGEVTHVTWLINPLLAGVGSVAVFNFFAAFANQTAARVTAILVALSPFVLFMAGSQMNHTATLACVWLALAALTRWDAARSPTAALRSAVLIGTAVGIAATIRPYDAVLVALAIGAFQLMRLRIRRWLIISVLVQCAVAVAIVSLVLAANHVTTGRAFAFAYDMLNGPGHRPGFHMAPTGVMHTPQRGVYLISAYLLKLDLSLLAWPVPAVLPVLCVLALQRRAARWESLMLLLAFLVLAGYAAYWSESYFIGPRFLFILAPVFIWFTAALPRVLRDRVALPPVRAAALLLLPMWLAISWIAPPDRSAPFGVRQLAAASAPPPSATRAIVNAVRRHGNARALVFVPDGMHARLAARLEALGARPLFAEQLVERKDACRLLESLDAAEGSASTISQAERLRWVVNRVEGDEAISAPLTSRAGPDRLALVTGRPVSITCARELSQGNPDYVSLAALLPYADFDSHGALGGGIVYARDFGSRNEMLRTRFRDMPWFTAHLVTTQGTLTAVLIPYPLNPDASPALAPR